MKLYGRYIFYKTIAGFAAIIAILISLIWFSRAITFVRYVTENGIELSKFFYLFVLILPWLLLLIIPVSLFMSILLIYNRLIASNEITILKNSGLTKLEICRPVLSLGIFASLICFGISFYLMPYANKELRILRIDFQDNYANLAFNPQTFERLKELTIYAKDRNENNQLSGILLHDERADQYSMTITAQTGRIITEDNAALLYMENGTVQKFNYLSRKSEILNFDNYVFNLSENNKGVTRLRWKSKERYLHELVNPEDDVEEHEIKRYRAELHQRFTYPLLSVIFSIIALACILRGGFNRSGNLMNIILAIFLVVIFFAIMITSYDLIESSPKFAPVLYLNFIIFFAVSLNLLTANFRKKK